MFYLSSVCCVCCYLPKTWVQQGLMFLLVKGMLLFNKNMLQLRSHCFCLSKVCCSSPKTLQQFFINHSNERWERHKQSGLWVFSVVKLIIFLCLSPFHFIAVSSSLQLVSNKQNENRKDSITLFVRSSCFASFVVPCTTVFFCFLVLSFFICSSLVSSQLSR